MSQVLHQGHGFSQAANAPTWNGLEPLSNETSASTVIPPESENLCILEQQTVDSPFEIDAESGILRFPHLRLSLAPQQPPSSSSMAVSRRSGSTIGLKTSAIGQVGRNNANWLESRNITAKLLVSLERGGDSDGVSLTLGTMTKRRLRFNLLTIYWTERT